MSLSTEYIVDQIAIGNTTTKSFYLKPACGGPIPAYTPGQHVKVWFFIIVTGEQLIRSYKLPDSPGKDYRRLTINEVPQGKSSDYFHNDIEVGDIIPLNVLEGNFTLDIQSTWNVMLLSAGIGITPMLSMEEYIQKNQPERKVHFIHSSRNKHTQIMKGRLHQIKDLFSNFNLCLLHSSPLKHEAFDRDYNVPGCLTEEIITAIGNGSAFYICGPDDYVKNIRSYLKDLGFAQITCFLSILVEIVRKSGPWKLSWNRKKPIMSPCLNKKKKFSGTRAMNQSQCYVDP